MRRVHSMVFLILVMATSAWAGDWQHATTGEAFKRAFVGVRVKTGYYGGYGVYDCERVRMEGDWVLADLIARADAHYRDEEGASVFHRLSGGWTYVGNVGGRGGPPQKSELTKLGIPPEVRSRLGYGDVPAAVHQSLVRAAQRLGQHNYTIATYGPKFFASTSENHHDRVGTTVVWEYVDGAWKQVFTYRADVPEPQVRARFAHAGLSPYMQQCIYIGTATSGQF